MTSGRPRSFAVSLALTVALFVAHSGDAAGKQSLAGGFDNGHEGWNAYKGKLSTPREGRGGASSLRWDYQIVKGQLVFVARGPLDSGQFAGAKGVRVTVRSDKLGPLHFNIRERDESSYQHAANVGSEWQVVDVRFSKLEMDADAGDENGRLDRDQIAELWIVDASGYYAPQLAGPRTVWVESIELIGAPSSSTSTSTPTSTPKPAASVPSKAPVTGTSVTANVDREVIASGPKSASNNLKADPTALREGNTFKLWYGGNRSGHGQEIYYATSPDGVKWTHHKGPVVRLGKRGAWDHGDVETPSVVKVGSTYHMYYCGRETQEEGDDWSKRSAYQIGHATSSDGIQWVKDPSNPVIKLGRQSHNDWNWAAAAEPTVLHDAGKGVFQLWYAGINVLEGKVHTHIGYATSPDGSRFANHADNPVIKSRPRSNSVEYNGFFTPEVVRDGERYLLFYVSDTWNSQPAGPIKLATSRDGVRWKQQPQSLVSKRPRSWNQDGVFGPTAVIAPDGLHLWYTGFSYEKDVRFGIGHMRLDVAKVR